MVNPTHQYMKGVHTCPVCEIDKKFNNMWITTSQQQRVQESTPVFIKNVDINTDDWM